MKRLSLSFIHEKNIEDNSKISAGKNTQRYQQVLGHSLLTRDMVHFFKDTETDTYRYDLVTQKLYCPKKVVLSSCYILHPTPIHSKSCQLCFSNIFRSLQLTTATSPTQVQSVQHNFSPVLHQYW